MKNRRLTLAAMIALLAVAVVGIFVGKLLATPSAIGPGGVRLDGIIVTFKPAAQTKDIYNVAGALMAEFLLLIHCRIVRQSTFPVNKTYMTSWN